MSQPSRSRVIFAAIFVSVLVPVIARAGITTQPAATQPLAQAATQPTTETARRSEADIKADLNAANQELAAMIPSPAVLLDDDKRVQVAPKAIPIVKRMVADFEELAQLEPELKDRVAQIKGAFELRLAMMDDADTIKALTDAGKSSDPVDSVRAQSILLQAKWLRSSKNATAQGEVIDAAAKVAHANPNDPNIFMLMGLIVEQGAATPELQDKALQILKTDMKDPRAGQLVEMAEAASKLKGMENKPLVLAGPLVDGKAFTTADWKGKVILVDFWATWCAPCRAELPRVKKAYTEYHDKGLEVLGVSCDRTAEALQGFLAQDKEMAWPQLFDAGNPSPGWHPLATQYGIESIPTMFLIDKKGILRTVTARESFEDMIPKLLAEKGE